MDLKLKGKVALVSGATSGVGRALCDALKAEGAKIALTGRDKAKVDAVVAELGMGADCKGYVADVSKEADVKAYIDAAYKDFGAIDILLPNAGYEGKWQMLAELSEDNFQEIFGVNLMGVVYMLKYASPYMIKAGKGSVVVTSSNGALVGSPGMALYCASKHAVQAVVKSAALELGPQGITVTSVNPGGIETPMIHRIEKNAFPDLDHEQASANFCAGYLDKRYSTAEEVAYAILYMASPWASHNFGSRIVMDGGDECMRP